MAPRIFFHFNILIFIYFFKYEIIETHARAFLTLNILSIGTVYGKVCKNPTHCAALTKIRLRTLQAVKPEIA